MQEHITWQDYKDGKVTEQQYIDYLKRLTIEIKKPKKTEKVTL